MKLQITLAILLTTLITNLLTARADTAAVYSKQCAKCHGPDGKGETKMGKKLGAKDYTDSMVQKKVTDEAMARSIKEGLKVDGKTKMKAFEDLTDKEITGLVAHMREFAKK
jgi:mono/diheme cytochrome c family protein